LFLYFLNKKASSYQFYQSSLTFTPRLVELCFQTAGLWEIGATGVLELPAAVNCVQVHGTPEAGLALRAEVIPVNGTTDRPTFDAVVRDDEGRGFLELRGYQTSPMPRAISEPDRVPFRAVNF
jgi:hypothetical protein